MPRRVLFGATFLLLGMTAASLVFSRYGYRLFLLSTEPSIEQFRLQVSGEEQRRRLESILGAFFRGYNAMIRPSGPREAARVCGGVDEFLRPFCNEGAGVGFGPRRYFHWGIRIRDFVPVLSRVDPKYLMAHHLGLGFWAGMRYRGSASEVIDLARGAARPGFEGFVFEGYGFRLSLVDSENRPFAVVRCRDLGPGAAEPCYQGVGRGYGFLFLEDPAEALRKCSDHPGPVPRHCWTGLGLTVAFTGIDALVEVLDRFDSAPPETRPSLQGGLRAALLMWDRFEPGFLEDRIGMLTGVNRRRVGKALQHGRDCYRQTITGEDFYPAFGACNGG